MEIVAADAWLYDFIVYVNAIKGTARWGVDMAMMCAIQ